jgi:8-oxo-dGTP diphosphatase
MATSHDSEVLAEGQQVITACALIHQQIDGKEKVFLPKRAASKKFLPNVFEMPGGHIDYGEDMVAGLQREIYEEFEMRVSVGDPFACFTYVNNVKRSHSVEVIYFAQFSEPVENIVLHPDDHSTYLWLAKDEMAQAFTEHKGADDVEFVSLQKGLALLDGRKLAFG